MTAQQEIQGWVDVNGYPTLRFYYKGVEFDYDGDRKGEDIINFMEQVIASKLPVV